MLVCVPLNHVAEVWGGAQFALARQRIATLVNLTAQLPGAISRRRHRPFRPAPDGHPALTARIAVVQRESPAAGAVNANGKAPHLGIKDLEVPPLDRQGLSYRFVV